MAKARRSKALRILAALALILVIFMTASIARYRTALPYIDRLRFGHWMWQEEWNALAGMLRERRDADEIFCLFENDDCQVRAVRWTSSWIGSEDVELSQEERAQIHYLMDAGHLYGLSRSDTSVYAHMLDVDKLDRSFSASLISPVSGYNRDRECDQQYREEYEGFCEVMLGENWLVKYQWRLTTEQQWAKCYGVWREYGPPPTTFSGVDVYRHYGNDAEYSQAVDELGSREAARFVEMGAAELLAAQSAPNAENLEDILDRCLASF